MVNKGVFYASLQGSDVRPKYLKYTGEAPDRRVGALVVDHQHDFSELA
jgi:hypothetical protein